MKIIFKDIHLPLEEGSLDLDLEIQGERIGIVGPSGAGKTSFLELIAGLRRPARGQLFWNHQRFIETSSRLFIPPHQRHIGYCPQDALLFPHLSVLQNILYGTSSTASHASIQQILHLLEIDSLLHRFPQNLSGGEKQRVSLARALAREPQLLLLDEPFSSLDSDLKLKAKDLLHKIQTEFKIPFFLVSHQIEEIQSLCDSTFKITSGEIAPFL
ncbi:MAG: ATP-binding cassette domain-containing protein [Verrucomicrobiota bacterium]